MEQACSIVPMNQDCKNMELAWNFVEWIIDRNKKLASSPKGSHLVEILGVDDMLLTAKQLIDCQAEFQKCGICTQVSLGFHYTKAHNLKRIEQDGLMTQAERCGNQKIDNKFHGRGLTYGDGIYISNNPNAFRMFGSIGIIVAIIKGECKETVRWNRLQPDANTVIGNKKDTAYHYGEEYFDEIVLQKSCQCLPLIKYDASLLKKNPSSSTDDPLIFKLSAYFKEMQRGVDKFFNKDNDLTNPVMSSGGAKNNDWQCLLPWPTVQNKLTGLGRQKPGALNGPRIKSQDILKPPSQFPSSRGAISTSTSSHQHQYPSSSNGNATPSSHNGHHRLHSPTGSVSSKSRCQSSSHHRSSTLSVGIPTRHSGHPSMISNADSRSRPDSTCNQSTTFNSPPQTFKAQQPMGPAHTALASPSRSEDGPLKKRRIERSHRKQSLPPVDITSSQPNSTSQQPNVSYPQSSFSAFRCWVPSTALSEVQSKPKPQEDVSLTFSSNSLVDQSKKDVASLNRGLQLPPQIIKLKCLDILQILLDHQYGWVFHYPVDPIMLAIPDYFQVIKKPMDLGTIKTRLENGWYSSLDGFKLDVKLTFKNAMLYNRKGSVVYNMAKEICETFDSDYGNLLRTLQPAPANIFIF